MNNIIGKMFVFIFGHIPERIHDKLFKYYVTKKYTGRVLSDVNYLDDYNRLNKYSVSNALTKNKDNYITLLISYYHIIEKGFSMPDFRKGFGVSAITELIRIIYEYDKKINDDSVHFIEAIKIVNNYILYHESVNYRFSIETFNLFSKFKNKFGYVGQSLVYDFTNKNYFKSDANFLVFSNSRHSLRNYDINLDVQLEQINKALELCENTPSACNRQPVNVCLVSDKKQIEQVLSVQQGNRGFGHKANKLIIIGVSLSRCIGVSERQQIFVDGGIYLMNLLYALHYYKIGACALNCNLSVENAKRLRRILDVSDDIVFVSMVSLGMPVNDFNTPKSLRTPFKEYTKYL